MAIEYRKTTKQLGGEIGYAALMVDEYAVIKLSDYKTQTIDITDRDILIAPDKLWHKIETKLHDTRLPQN